MKIAFIYYNFYDHKNKSIHLGGAEHYIYRLTEICAEIGHEPIVVQIAGDHFETAYQHIKIIGVRPPIKHFNFNNKLLYEAALAHIDIEKDLVVFAADLCSVKTDNPRCISINHGLFWDYPTSMSGGPYPYKLDGFVGRLYKGYIKLRMRRLFDNCNNRVCVDYNFLNWYRTVTNNLSSKTITVVPNFARIADEEQLSQRHSGERIKILFARRFAEYRGTRIMAQAAREILQRYPDVEFTFAGDGPDKEYLLQMMGGESRVTFTQFGVEESLAMNLKHDICVIPSLAAEGTSLSVAEAMGAGKVVVASNVGGITNMIIDGYNGLLINPDADSLVQALSKVIDDEELRISLGRAAYATCKHSFSYQRWKKAWVNIIENLASLA